jgi:hypothetical protein
VIDGEAPRSTGLETRPQQLFYGLFLPIGVLANLALGLLLLIGLNPASWMSWLQIAIGALCCVIAGWIAAVAWSKFFWNRSMAKQVATWRRIADAFFSWIEHAPVPAEALDDLKSSLEAAVPGPKAR